jgi:hypothetical protein
MKILRGVALPLLALLLLAACVTGPVAGSFSLDLDASEVAVATGDSVAVGVTVLRSGAFTGAVALSLVGAPVGVTASFDPASVAGDASAMTLNVGPDTAEGDYDLNVRAVGNGEQTAELTLTVVELPPTTIDVDPSVEPTVTTLPALPGGPPRPVAALIDEDGHRADFVSDELIVVTDDPLVLDAFLARWNGELLDSIDHAAAGLDLEAMHLVRIDPSATAAADLPADLARLAPGERNDLRVSSQGAVSLLSAFAQEAVAGLEVAINWLGVEDQFLDGESVESGNIPGGGSSNAFDWWQFSNDSTAEIRVTRAWQALEVADRLDNRVTIAVLDGGFEPNDDFPPGWQAFSVYPGKAPTGVAGLGTPWHGTAVVQAAAGVADNGFGAAGVAGPVADIITVYTSSDFFFSSAAVTLAVAEGADIINMSYRTVVPATLTPSVLPFNAITLSARALGVLIFGSAGNEGVDVDAEDCFVACWEEEWHTPCENGGVICVGGIKRNRWRNGSSNYGAEEVDIFAPFTVRVGPDDHGNDGNMARDVNGTSFSSPFTAGVAALIWAADPSLSANQVEGILMSTAHGSPDPKVPRYVNAYGAVHEALGNLAPLLTITAPATGAEVGFGGLNAITFSGEAFDVEDLDGCCAITWTSDVDGLIGTGTGFEYTFPTPGIRFIDVVATDSDGLIDLVKLVLLVQNDPPEVEILSPQPGDDIFQDVPFVVQGHATDLNNAAGPPCTNYRWTSSKAGDPEATGCDAALTFTTLGSRTLTLTVTDNQGESGSDSVAIDVVAAPVEWVVITDPQANQAFFPTEEIELRAAVSQDISLLAPFEWRAYEQAVGGAYEVIGSGQVSFNPISGQKRIPLRTWIPGFAYEGDSLWLEIVVNGSVFSGRLPFNILDVPN